MKKIFTLFAMLPLMPAAFGQITITVADAPVPTAVSEFYSRIGGIITSPTVGNNISWDYTSYSGPLVTLDYAVETDAFFTAAGCNRGLTGQDKHLNANLVYYYAPKYDFNSSGIYEKGIDIAEQLYDISIYTGSAGDSFKVDEQRHILSTPSIIREYPITLGSSWSSVSRRITNFKLTIADAGMSNTPCTHVYYAHRSDTVVGWGKMKVYTASGPSAEYDVLMDKITDYMVDSFYVGSSPAPAALLSGFGLSQGQKTDAANRYMFLIKGTFSYLASIVYYDDMTFTTVGAININKSDLPASVSSVEGGTYTTVLFPNPANGNEVNLMINGPVKADSYSITDMQGRVVEQGSADMRQNILHVSYSAGLPAGQYMLTVNSGNSRIASETFTVVR